MIAKFIRGRVVSWLRTAYSPRLPIRDQADSGVRMRLSFPSQLRDSRGFAPHFLCPGPSCGLLAGKACARM